MPTPARLCRRRSAHVSCGAARRGRGRKGSGPHSAAPVPARDLFPLSAPPRARPHGRARLRALPGLLDGLHLAQAVRRVGGGAATLGAARSDAGELRTPLRALRGKLRYRAEDRARCHSRFLHHRRWHHDPRTRHRALGGDRLFPLPRRQQSARHRDSRRPRGAPDHTGDPGALPLHLLRSARHPYRNYPRAHGLRRALLLLDAEELHWTRCRPPSRKPA